jgi:hypothetical protein
MDTGRELFALQAPIIKRHGLLDRLFGIFRQVKAFLHQLLRLRFRFCPLFFPAGITLRD